MDGWPRMTRLERDIARIGVVYTTAVALIGAGAGWCLRFFTERHTTISRSDHFRNR